MTELQTDEPIVLKPTLALVVRLMCRLTGLHRLQTVANVGLQEIQRVACWCTFTSVKIAKAAVRPK